MDVKQDDENTEVLVRKISDLVRKYDREDLTIWGSMRPRVHNVCAKAAPDIPRFFSASQVRSFAL